MKKGYEKVPATGEEEKGGPLFAKLAVAQPLKPDPVGERPKSAYGYGSMIPGSPLADVPFRSYDLSTPAKRLLADTSSEGGSSDDLHGRRNNHATALESLSSLGIWLLLITPYIMLAIALLLDLNTNLRVASTTFLGNVSECATSAQEQESACVHVVNANFSTLHSGPLMVPLQSSFFNLDVVFTANFITAFAPPTPPQGDAAPPPEPEPLMPLPPDPPIPAGQINQMHLQEQATIDSDASPDPTDSDNAGVLIGARLEVPLEDGSGWETLYQGDMRDLGGSCDSGTGVCVGMRLLFILFDTPGVRRGFPTYRVAITLAGPLASQGLPSLRCTVHHDRPAYLFVMAALRAILIAATILGGYLWFSSILRESPRFCEWVPEQQHMAFMFPTLLLWQDPISLTLFWLERPKPSLLFAADLIHACGYQALLLLWWLVMDGLGSYGASKDAWVRAMGGTVVSMPQPPPWPPKHHPRGEYFLDFLVPKLAFFSLSFLSVLAICSLRYPEVFLSADDAHLHLRLLRLLYAACSLALLGLMLLWYLIFAKATLATGRTLRQQPYMQTRSQQLSYRFFVQQLALILVCKGAGYVFEALHLYHLLHRNFRQLQMLWHAELSLESLQLPYWVSSFRSSPGELLFISTSCYLATLIFLPARRWTEAEVGGGSLPHACMESELGELERRRRRMPFLHASSSPPPVFCLETACWLMEAAWQAYYDPAGRLHKMDEESSSNRMALENLGLGLEAFLSHVGTDTHAVLARGRQRLVLSFRGTLTVRNMQTDMAVAQRPLPNFAPRKPRIKISRPPSTTTTPLKGLDGANNQQGPNGSIGAFPPPPPRIASVNGTPPTTGHVRQASNSQSSGKKLSGVQREWTERPPEEKAADAQLGHGQEAPAAAAKRGSNPFSDYELQPPPRPSLADACRRHLERLPGVRQALPHVHAGFLHAYLSVRQEVMSAVKAALEHDYAPLVLTGHSLGGALAQLAAYDLSLNFDLPDPIRVYNYGSPRVGNVAFSRLYNPRVPSTFRVVVDGDMVPGWPKMFGIYRHAGIEVLVDAECGGNLIVNPTVVEKALRLKNRTSTTNHSLTTYRECLEACFSSNDLLEYLRKVIGKDNRTSADEELPAWLIGSRKQEHILV